MQILHKSASIAPGVGRITLDTHGSDAVFSELSYAYPLKLLSPRLHQAKVAVVYVVSYGGGLVGGDQVEVSAVIKNDAILVILTQVRAVSSDIRLQSFTRSNISIGVYEGVQNSDG